MTPDSVSDPTAEFAAFEFATAGRIVFGAGKLAEAGALARQVARSEGGRALLVTGADIARAAPLQAILQGSGFDVVNVAIHGEPTIQDAQAGVQAAREAGCSLVIGLGGGSAIDAGKAIAALMTNPGDPLDYLEVIGRGQPLRHAPAPYVAIPTTAGTGAEVTRNAVLASKEHRVKVSLRSPLMLPDVALIDPELTYSLPPDITAYTGLDALTQVIEPYVSARANPLTDALCASAIPRAARALRRAVQDGANVEARHDMALVSLMGGLALANAGLGAVHGFAGPFGGMYPGAPHGAVCAALLPVVMVANIAALDAREPKNPALGRYAQIAAWLTGQQHAAPQSGAIWLARLVRDLKIPGLGTYGFALDHAPDLIEKAARSSSMKGNPLALTPDELGRILENAI